MRDGTTRLYLSGDAADQVAEHFFGARIEPRVIDGAGPTAASALKMVYGAWTKGSIALLLAIEQTALADGVADVLHDEWELSDRANFYRYAKAGSGHLVEVDVTARSVTA